jgi:hypothetical protein
MGSGDKGLVGGGLDIGCRSPSSQGEARVASIFATRKYHSWETSTRTRECLGARTLERVQVPTRRIMSTHEYSSTSVRALWPPFGAQIGSPVTKF